MTVDMDRDLSIGIVGGTGQEGSGLALRLARAGHKVVIGSREAAKAATRAAELHCEARSGFDFRRRQRAGSYHVGSRHAYGSLRRAAENHQGNRTGA